ncbi:sulfotransferase family protein [Acidisoma sp. S159]|uniref:sulfotransferase family protein n=1 Tax=Acidisoma sp. S159 TaxID=1747225 RepID=UPI00131AAC40|nr:hypothetical protein [Acidisoma sp. S159]
MDNGQVGDTAILVLGSHRSGTSATTGVLYRLGVELGSNLMPAMKDNPKGFYEHFGIAPIHNELIAMLDSDWSDPCSLPQDWDRDPRIAPFRERIIQTVQEEFANKPLWGLKDPRVCRLLPLWHQIFSEVQVTGKALIVIRPPIEVALSLLKRDKMSIEQGLMLWSSHVLDAELHSRRMTRSAIFYQDLLQDWISEMRRVRDELGVEFAAFSPEITDEVSNFLDGDLRHYRDPAVPRLYAPQSVLADRIYDAMVAWRRDGISPTSACDEIREQFSYIERGAAPITAYMRSRAGEARRRAENELKDAETRAEQFESLVRRLEAEIRQAGMQAEHAEEAISHAYKTIAGEQARAEALEGQLIGRDQEIRKILEREAISAAERQREHEERQQEHADAVHRIAQVAERIAREETKSAVLLAGLSNAEVRISQFQHERTRFLSSTSWRITAPLRKIGNMTPSVFKRSLRGSVKLVWWSLTFQLPKKLRQRRAIQLKVQTDHLMQPSGVSVVKNETETMEKI